MGVALLQVKYNQVRLNGRCQFHSLCESSDSRKIGDSVPVLIIIFVLFVLPVKLNFWCFASPSPEGSTNPPKPNEAMLNWTYLQQRLPWGLVLLLGIRKQTVDIVDDV